MLGFFGKKFKMNHLINHCRFDWWPKKCLKLLTKRLLLAPNIHSLLWLGKKSKHPFPLYWSKFYNTSTTLVPLDLYLDNVFWLLKRVRADQEAQRSLAALLRKIFESKICPKMDAPAEPTPEKLKNRILLEITGRSNDDFSLGPQFRVFTKKLTTLSSRLNITRQ